MSGCATLAPVPGPAWHGRSASHACQLVTLSPEHGARHPFAGHYAREPLPRI